MQDSKRDPDVLNSLLDSVGEGEGGMVWENGIETCILYIKETRIERDTCTPMFNTALFTIARTWKQPRCPSADK